jgi:hypothetical protein
MLWSCRVSTGHCSVAVPVAVDEGRVGGGEEEEEEAGSDDQQQVAADLVGMSQEEVSTIQEALNCCYVALKCVQ